MRALMCRLFGHVVEQRIRYFVGGIYPRVLVWCECCGHWYEDEPPIRRRASWLR